MNDETINAEVVPTQAVAVRPPTGLPTVADLEQQFSLAVRQRELLSEYIKKQLQPGKHFYQRGDQKPSLTKEGAEIILLPHNLAPDYEWVSGPAEPLVNDQPYQITIKCILRIKGHPDSFVGSGIGSAGSHKGYWKRERGKPDEWAYQPRQTDKYLCHNATVKMAEKSAMIAATINSTAASEFFTQDMEGEAQNGSGRAAESRPPSDTRPVGKTPPAASQRPKEKIPASLEQCLARFVANMDREKLRDKATGFCIDLAWLLPTEKLEDLPLRFVPSTKEQYVAFLAKLTSWSVSGKVEKPYESNPDAEPAKKNVTTPDAPVTSSAASEPWYNFIVPIPPKGVNRDEYLKHPQTIGELYEARHGDDDESNAMRQRLWGFLNHFEPKGWTKRDGTQMPPSKTDIQFREMLDAFGEFFEKNHPGEEP